MQSSLVYRFGIVAISLLVPASMCVLASASISLELVGVGDVKRAIVIFAVLSLMYSLPFGVFKSLGVTLFWYSAVFLLVMSIAVFWLYRYFMIAMIG